MTCVSLCIWHCPTEVKIKRWRAAPANCSSGTLPQRRRSLLTGVPMASLPSSHSYAVCVSGCAHPPRQRPGRRSNPRGPHACTLAAWSAGSCSLPAALHAGNWPLDSVEDGGGLGLLHFVPIGGSARPRAGGFRRCPAPACLRSRGGARAGGGAVAKPRPSRSPESRLLPSACRGASVSPGGEAPSPRGSGSMVPAATGRTRRRRPPGVPPAPAPGAPRPPA